MGRFALPSLPGTGGDDAGTDSGTGTVLDPPPEIDVTDPSSIAGRVGDAMSDLGAGFVERLPLVVLSLVVFLLGLLIVHWASRGVERVTRTQRLDESVTRLVRQVSRIVLLSLVLLLALSVAGVQVGSALAALGIAGLAVAFAVQSILENFIAGILILIRKPFTPGDQIRVTEFEGTVEDINLRVTKLRDYDGESILVPNAQVLASPIINLTERPARRTRVGVAVDYRDDHDAARDVIRAAVNEVEGVLATPAPQVLLVELGDSGVNFEVRYWTAPDIASVVAAQDRVLSAAKRAIEGAGMTIPWPIRTLVLDDAVRVRAEGALRADGGVGDAAMGEADARAGAADARPGADLDARPGPDLDG